jgi:cell division protein FtsQ
VSAKIARGSGTRPKPKSTGRSVSTRKAKGGAMDALPVSAETVKRVSWYILLGMIGAVALALLSVFQVPQLVGTAAGEAIGEAGFAVKSVEIKGLNRMERLNVYAVALDQPSMAMPLVDLDQTRDRMLALGYVADARVSRRWPDTLVVDIVERTPAAVWQHNQQLSLIDKDGVVLEPVRLEAMPDLPLVIGPSANTRAGHLDRLLRATPQLKPMLAGATWVGGRRWDLRFQSGEVLALPEGEETASKALTHFARMDKLTGLLGRGLVRFDMRIPGKFVVRVSSEPAASSRPSCRRPRRPSPRRLRPIPAPSIRRP